MLIYKKEKKREKKGGNKIKVLQNRLSKLQNYAEFSFLYVIKSLLSFKLVELGSEILHVTCCSQHFSIMSSLEVAATADFVGCHRFKCLIFAKTLVSHVKDQGTVVVPDHICIPKLELEKLILTLKSSLSILSTSSRQRFQSRLDVPSIP